MTLYLHYGMILVRLLCLALCLCGYLLYLQKSIRIELALGVLFAGIGSLMFAAGIFHILRETAWLIFAGGIWFLLQACRKEDRFFRSLFKDICTPGMVVFLLWAVFFLVLLFRSEFTHYDNFSHWGVAAKVVCEKDMFPNTANTNVTFTSYPLGSASFIYFITEIVGTAPEWLQMWAQAILMAGMLTGLFAFGSGLICGLTAAAGTMMLLCGNTPLVDLLVDTLLPVVAMGAMAFCIYYRMELAEKIWFVIPYTVFLMSSKNSGILFVAVLLLYVLTAIPRNRDNGRKILILCLSPVVSLFFWNRHVEQVFDDGTVSKHAMRVDNFQQVLAEKTPEDLQMILEAFRNETAARLGMLFFLCLLAVLLLGYRKFILKKNCRELCGLLLFTGFSYVLYLLGLLGMYIFSMPIEEALMMAGYWRYYQTIVIFVAGMMLIAGIRELRDSRGKKFGFLCTVVLGAILLIQVKNVVQPNFNYFTRQDLENTDRAHFDRLISDYGLWPGDSYLILFDEEQVDGGYLYYMAHYLLAPEDVAVVTMDSIKTLDENRFNFAILFSDTEANRQYMQNQLGLSEEVGYIAGKPLR